MSSPTAQLAPESPDPFFPLTVKQYHTMIDAGVLTEDDPVELLDGLLIQKTPKKPRHRLTLRKLFKVIDKVLPDGWFIQLQEPITLSTSEPEPDASIVRGADEDYAVRHPGPNDVPLVIEVADATLRRDRGIKLRSYARGGIEVYWIVNLEARCVEVYRNPDARASPPTYQPPEVYDENSTVPLELSGRKVGEIRVANILP